jgi:hypothetical protein
VQRREAGRWWNYSNFPLDQEENREHHEAQRDDPAQANSLGQARNQINVCALNGRGN